MRRLKAMGFSDRRLAELNLKSANIAGTGVKTRARSHGLLHDAVKAMIGATTEDEVRALRHRLGVRPVFKRIDTCAAEFEAKTPYMYSTYEAPSFGAPEDESQPIGPAQDRHPRRRAEPDRAGDRVRLLLRATPLTRSTRPASRRS